MEDTLRVLEELDRLINETVLILVLMEDTLRACNACSVIIGFSVLILVLMEDTLREVENQDARN